jgi:hypothetical protein
VNKKNYVKQDIENEKIDNLVRLFPILKKFSSDDFTSSLLKNYIEKKYFFNKKWKNFKKPLRFVPYQVEHKDDFQELRLKMPSVLKLDEKEQALFKNEVLSKVKNQILFLEEKQLTLIKPFVIEDLKKLKEKNGPLSKVIFSKHSNLIYQEKLSFDRFALISNEVDLFLQNQFGKDWDVSIPIDFSLVFNSLQKWDSKLNPLYDYLYGPWNSNEEMNFFPDFNTSLKKIPIQEILELNYVKKQKENLPLILSSSKLSKNNFVQIPFSADLKGVSGQYVVPLEILKDSSNTPLIESTPSYNTLDIYPFEYLSISADALFGFNQPLNQLNNPFPFVGLLSPTILFAYYHKLLIPIAKRLYFRVFSYVAPRNQGLYPHLKPS